MRQYYFRYTFFRLLRLLFPFYEFTVGKDIEELKQNILGTFDIL